MGTGRGGGGSSETPRTPSGSATAFNSCSYYLDIFKSQAGDFSYTHTRLMAILNAIF